jgi:hypothetical protein
MEIIHVLERNLRDFRALLRGRQAKLRVQVAENPLAVVAVNTPHAPLADLLSDSPIGAATEISDHREAKGVRRIGLAVPVSCLPRECMSQGLLSSGQIS